METGEMMLLIGIIFVLLVGLLLYVYKSAAGRISLNDITLHYVPKDLYTATQQDLSKTLQELNDCRNESGELKIKLSKLEQRHETYVKEMEDVRAQFKHEFKVMAQEIMEEKSKRFVDINEEKLGLLLSPLKDRIQHFERKMEETYKDEMKERISLKKELESIISLNKQVSEDTTRLTNALKGDKKLQGNWGEVQLEMILQKAGLQENVHYVKEKHLASESGQARRPDYIVLLPEDKCVIIDSKVSLVAYEQFFNEEDDLLRKTLLKKHIDSLREHIRSLGDKNYHQLYQVQSPDYILMFVPLEPALYAALGEDSTLFDKALDRNIVLVSVSNLLATLRTVAFIWKQDNQTRHVMEIARESGALYDKFVNFLEDLEKVGKGLSNAERDLNGAMNKLYYSPKKGDTIIGRMERIKSLGADASKSIPEKYISLDREDV